MGKEKSQVPELKIYSGDRVRPEAPPVANWTTEANTSKVIKLAPGTYTLTESYAPDGYQYVDVTFTVNADGSITIVQKGYNRYCHNNWFCFVNH